MLDVVRQREESKMTPRFSAQVTEQMTEKSTEKEITEGVIYIEGKDKKHAHAYMSVEILSREKRMRRSGEGSELQMKI